MLIKDISWIVRKTQEILKDISKKAKERLHKVDSFKRLKLSGCSEKEILKTLEVSRATIYRWNRRLKQDGLLGLEPKSTRPRRLRKSFLREHIRPRVIALSRQYPLWGPKKIGILLSREKIFVSSSTIARVMKTIPLTHEQQLVRKKIKRRRDFSGKHAQRWRFGMQSEQPGELIQIDHMSVGIAPGRVIKHFQATCPNSKITVAQVYSVAISSIGAKFLQQLEQDLPFGIKSIQVDGGSEFMKDFEALCAKKQYPLWVLPPKSPKLNGCVERRNRTLREEFYALYDGDGYLEDIRKNLNEYLQVYNNIRPHQALDNLTPNEYINTYWQEIKKSQML